MGTLVVYDSAYGNTQAIADAIAAALGADVRARRASDVDASALGRIDVLVVGSPTQGGRPTAAVSQFLQSLPSTALRGTSVFAFDTRLDAKEQGRMLRALMSVIGYAGPRIAQALEAKGGTLAAPPEGFIVTSKEGPLRPGETERARRWAEQVIRTVAATLPPSA